MGFSRQEYWSGVPLPSPINMLGISELKWTGMGEFNSGDHYIYYGKRNGVALTVNKSLKCSTWVQSQKWLNNISLFPRQTIQYHSNPSLCFNHWCRRSRSWTVLWRPIRPSRTNNKKRYPFHLRGLECQSGKSRDTWSNKQVWLWVQNEAGQRLTEFCQEKTLVIANTLFHQHKRWFYTWSSSYGNTETRLIIFFADKDGEALYSQKKWDLELTIAHTISSLLPNSGLNWRKQWRPLGHSGLP